MEERITELEIKLTYQEDTVVKLNEVIIRQQEQLEGLARRLSELEQQRLAGSGYDPGAANDPPPHY